MGNPSDYETSSARQSLEHSMENGVLPARPQRRQNTVSQCQVMAIWVSFLLLCVGIFCLGMGLLDINKQLSDKIQVIDSHVSALNSSVTQLRYELYHPSRTQDAAPASTVATTGTLSSQTTFNYPMATAKNSQHSVHAHPSWSTPKNDNHQIPMGGLHRRVDVLITTAASLSKNEPTYTANSRPTGTACEYLGNCHFRLWPNPSSPVVSSVENCLLDRSEAPPLRSSDVSLGYTSSRASLAVKEPIPTTGWYMRKQILGDEPLY